MNEDKLLLDFMRQVNDEFKATRQQMVDQHNELKGDIARNREEFVIFRTKVNTKTAMISAIIGAVVLISSLLLNIDAIRERHQEKGQAKTEQRAQ